MTNEQPGSRQQGLTLIETLVAIVIYAIILGAIAASLNYGPRQVQQAAAASQLKTLGSAMDAYVKANYATLEGSATATNAVAVPVSTLVTQNYLPTRFSAVNAYGQTYTIYILQPKAGNLMGLILGTGGTVWNGTSHSKHLADVLIPGAAAMAGAAGGFVSTGDLPGYTIDTVRGAYGGWQVSLAGTNISNPGPTHLAFMHYYNQGSLASDYLYRYAIPGQPQLNEMFTNLNMGGNNITNANSVNAVTLNASGNVNASQNVTARGDVTAKQDVTAENGNVALSRAADYETLVSDGSHVPEPDYCPSGARPEIFVTPVYISSGPSDYPVSSYQGWATNHGSYWAITLRVLTQNGWIYPPSPYLVAKVAVKCG